MKCTVELPCGDNMELNPEHPTLKLIAESGTDLVLLDEIYNLLNDKHMNYSDIIDMLNTIKNGI